MNEKIAEIKNYILFLRKTCNLEVSLHPFNDEQLISKSELMAFNMHENSYCIYIKSFPDAHRRCIESQKKLADKCRGCNAFTGICHAGVFEYVYPIVCNGLSCGFISVSGYKAPDFSSYIKSRSQKFNIPEEGLLKAYTKLKGEVPEKSYIDTLMMPLVRMLELLYIKSDDTEEDSSSVEKIIRYVNRFYMQHITLDVICKEFYLSRSYISHRFKKATGKSFRQYLTDVRINAAKNLLLNSELSVTEIALCVGFCDSNYFSKVFKEYTGSAPRNYNLAVAKL